MRTNKLKRLLLLAVILVTGEMLWAQSEELVRRVDSCRTVAASQSGAERLNTLHKMVLLSTSTDKEFELRLAQELEDEATKQGDLEMIGTAKYRKVCVWWNHKEIDKYMEEIGREMEACRKLGAMDMYYRLTNLKGEQLMLQGTPLTALRFITPIMEEARKANNIYGIAACSDIFGQIYTAMGDNAQAEGYLLEAVEKYKRLGDKGTNGLMDAYFKLCNVYFSAYKYAKAAQLTHDYEQLIIDSEKAGTKNINIPARYGLCYFLRGVAVYHQGNNPQEVVSCYEKMMFHTDNGRILNTLIPTLEMYSTAARGDYPKALEMVDKQIALYIEANMEMGALVYFQDKAKYLEAMGRYKEANELLKDYIKKADKLRSDESLQQQNELSALYELEKKETHAQLMQSWLIGAVACCLLLVLLASFVVYHNNRLRQKNHALYLQYQKQKQAEEIMDKVMEQHPTHEIPDKEMQLFIKIRQLLKDKELLANEALDRNLLAEKLHTNYTYISKAVQTGADMSVNRYINRARIDYACELLRQKGQYTITEVQEMCGFQSSTSFNRAFKEVTQMTPTNFQKESSK